MPQKKINAKNKANSMSLWDESAAWYDSLVGDKGNDYHKSIILPGAFRLLGMKKNDTVLDLACGQGVFSRYLLSRGINHVEGLDASGEMASLAAERSNKTLSFHVGDAGDEGILEGKRFDVVVCLLAVQNIKNLKPVFANVSRWLNPDGRFLMVMTHPCFRIPRQTHWGWDEEKKTQFRRVDHYASEVDIPIFTPPIKVSGKFTTTHHRPLQNYFAELSSAGLWVDTLEEWTSKKTSQPGKRSRAENRARKEIPLFLAMRARPGLII